ncbi:MAG: hypothetical protein PHO13_06320 [Fermentimonas sp.]|jgi:hypothetical protein|nr:hypothetical protein [Fermentimonas sp.]NLC85561.1 hypothetical protein [Bacteroidales bacterium]HBT85995.1 hypothetical protein [Porphyromonadaceae bacterium]MDD2930433.1 hypothetical protein [Fermentimonas sp.]MDD3189097.1 hypothetical protein [Fermentimonas sp.]
MKNQSVILVILLLCHTLILPAQINGQLSNVEKDTAKIKSDSETTEMISLQYNSNMGEFQIHAPTTYALARNSTIFDFPETSPIINLSEIQIVAP